MLGRTLAHYGILERIASGGLGEVLSHGRGRGDAT